MGAARGGGIFISYRREGTDHFAARLATHLISRFGARQVFLDVETIRPGADFAEASSRAVDTCTVLVAVIGPGWLAAVDERGRRRLDNPADLVRLEIGTALARGVAVIPVLTDGAVMPGRGDLPEDLAGFDRRNALRFRHESFRTDAGRLIEAIEAIEAIEQERASAFAGADQAARLYGDAERIAKSITPDPRTGDLLKTWALGEIAEALADTDPDRAEHIANSITDEYKQAPALARVAQALACTDRDRAARLFRDAERIANSLTEEYRRLLTLAGVAEALGRRLETHRNLSGELAGQDGGSYLVMLPVLPGSPAR
jgi:hypothetical protein